MSVGSVQNLKQKIPLNSGYKELGSAVIPVSLDDFWKYYLADNADLSWTKFRVKGMKAWNTMSTKWSTSPIPNQGANWSWPGDNFKNCYPGETALLMSCTGSTINYETFLTTYQP
jgi:hypothetical protein